MQEVDLGDALRKVADAAEARSLLMAWSASGEAMGRFCEARGINRRSLNIWRVNLARWGEEPATEPPRTALDLVELVAASSRASEETRYRLVVGDVVLELDDRFRDETVLRLLRLARQC